MVTPNPFPLQILAISGSLRAASANTTVLRAAILLAPDAVSSVTLPVTTNRLDEATLLAKPVLSQALKSAIEALVRAAIVDREGVGSDGLSLVGRI